MTAASVRTRFPALDGLRGLAALAIVVTHAGFASGRSAQHDLLAAVLGRADFGVAVFFLLSGFLLYRPYAVHALGGTAAPRILRFWWRRALRVLPALWLAVTVTLGLISTRSATTNDWLQHLLLVDVYDHHELDANFTQLWTLSAEIAFYLLLPLLGAVAAFRVRRPFERQLAMVAVLVATSMAFDLYQHRYLSHEQAVLWLPAYLDWFAWGILLGLMTAGEATGRRARALQLTLRAWAADPLTCIAVAAIAWSLTLTQLGTPRVLVLPSFWQWTAQHYLYGIAGLFLLLPLVLGPAGPASRLLGSRFGHFLGNISYSVYLWHLALLLLIQRELGYETFSGHFWLLLVLAAASSIAVASASWYLFERPILRYGTRPWRPSDRLRGEPAASTTAPSVNS
jgi:peptidoglycan/LPS O-acetylase OafA/YrhL